MKEFFSVNNFELDENGRKLLKRVENAVGKGEIAGNQHFLLFPQYFLLYEGKILIFGPCLICRLQMISNRTSLKSCHLLKSYRFNNNDLITLT